MGIRIDVVVEPSDIRWKSCIPETMSILKLTILASVRWNARISDVLLEAFCGFR
jgi:hypothetical protein